MVHPFDDREVVREELGRVDDPDDPAREIADVVGGSGRRRRADLVVTAPAYVDSRRPVPAGCSSRSSGERVDGHDYAARRSADAAVLGSRADRRARPSSSTTRSSRSAGWPGTCVDRLRRDRARADRVAGQDRHQGLPRPRARRGRRRRSPPPATTTTRSACRSPCCAPTPTPATSSSRWAPAASATSPTCARSPRRTVAAVLNVGTAHVGEFGRREAIARRQGRDRRGAARRRGRGAQRRRRRWSRRWRRAPTPGC